ncbi:ABC transporter ATP-binding protein [Agrilutibacter niabensis]|uniref:ABC transporter ATP-binding protein n=1 Tax=Agrilutibacter niabensis TaxID=380628 RepID=UPI00286D6911|nr:ABC transporter ATP-binding protein [Lysobacter niabensis]
MTKHYGEGEASVPALQGVDLDVRPGELLMLVGPSGCGKTTLVSIITTVLDQDGGECEVLGHDMRVMGERERARLRNEAIGIVFQSFHLLPALSALDNVAVPLLLAHVPRAEAETRARRALDSVGLGTRRDALPARLSGGESQRVAIARALVREPKLLVCDEPTSNLDASTGHTVMEMLRDVAKASDRALLVVTHDSRIFDFADRIARMEDGRVVEVTDNMQPGAAA